MTMTRSTPKTWTPPSPSHPKNDPSGLKIYRLSNKKTYVWVAARDEAEARKLADRVCDDFLPWSVSYSGAQHDSKARSRGVLTHEKLMSLFALPPVKP